MMYHPKANLYTTKTKFWMFDHKMVEAIPYFTEILLHWLQKEFASQAWMHQQTSHFNCLPDVNASHKPAIFAVLLHEFLTVNHSLLSNKSQYLAGIRHVCDVYAWTRCTSIDSMNYSQPWDYRIWESHASLSRTCQEVCFEALKVTLFWKPSVEYWLNARQGNPQLPTLTCILIISIKSGIHPSHPPFEIGTRDELFWVKK